MFHFKWNTRTFVLCLIALLLIGALSTGGVWAYLKANTDTVSNDFSVAPQKDPVIKETFDGTTKENVYIQVGDVGYSVYVRCAIVANWVSKTDSSIVHALDPVAGTDFQLNLNTTDWFIGSDGFYYYKNAVTSGSNTTALITSCTPIDSRVPDGFYLEVKVHAQTVQALGFTDGGVPAVKDAWKVVTADGNGGTLSAVTP